jgi:biopolymer transport protein ExbB/TolQ
MKLFWKKVWEKIKRYWQVLLGLFVGLGVALKFWWRLRAQKKVLKNEIETAKKVRKVEEDFSTRVDNIEKDANQKHRDRVKEAKAEEEESKAEVKKELEDRIEANRDGSNTDLANKIGDSMGVNVVIPEDNDE